MKIETRWIFGIAVVLVVLAMTLGLPVVQAQATHARWDLISLDTSTAPPTLSPGGIDSAAGAGGIMITFTGSGTFVAPAGDGGSSNAVTGGGTWETFDSLGNSTGSGTYQVTELVRFEFANFQTGSFIDLIGNTNQRANGSAVLRIEYLDGSQGTLLVGCHGPGAPNGIFEGIVATKSFVTYWANQAPVPGVNANRTIFHVM